MLINLDLSHDFQYYVFDLKKIIHSFVLLLIDNYNKILNKKII